MTAITRCVCVNNARIRWSTQEYAPDTNLRSGNIAVVASAIVAPVSFVDLDDMFRAAGIASVSKATFDRIAKRFVFPSIEDMFYKMQSDLSREVGDRISISVDGNYDSPGFTAEYCTVSAIEQETKQVVAFATIQKSETDNISARMELEGVKRVLNQIEKDSGIENVTVDKHPSVCKFLRENGYSYSFDPWHLLKKMQKEIRNQAKKITDDDEKMSFKILARRLMLHVYKSIEIAEGKSRVEKILSFFLHVQQIHSWHIRNFTDLIHVEPGTKTGDFFKHNHFEHVLECSHPQNRPSKHAPTSPHSRSFQFLLELVSNNVFVKDLSQVTYGNCTSEVESFHNVCIVYHPKRKFYPRRGYEVLISLHPRLNF